MSYVCSKCLMPSLLLPSICGHLVCVNCFNEPFFECVKCLEFSLRNLSRIDGNTLIQSINKNPYIINVLKVNNTDMIEYAITKCPLIIRNVKFQNDKNIKLALSLDGNVAPFIENMNIYYAHLAIKTTPEILPNINPKFLNSEIIFKTILRKPEILPKLKWLNLPDYLCEILLKNDPTNIIHFPVQRRDWCLYALRKDGNLIQFMIQTAEYCLEAINQNPKSFQYIDDEFQNFNLAKLAIEKDPTMLKYSIIQYEVLIPDAILKMPSVIEYIYDQKIEYCNLAIEAKPETIRFIKFLDVELWKKAINKNPLVIKYWYKKNEKYLQNLIKEENINKITEIYNYAIEKNPTLVKNYPLLSIS